MVFRLFWILTRKTCVFAGKFLAGLSKKLWTCPVEHLQSKFSEWKSWKLEGFRKNFWKFRSNRGKVFHTWQNSNRCPREQFMKNFFFKREKFALFSNSVRIFTSSEKFCQSCETRNLCIHGNFWGKTIFEISIFFHTFFGLWSKKRLVGKKIFFPDCHNCNPRVQRHFLRKSTFF